jgi:hypothetical protein
MSLGRVVERESDEVSESLKSFRVSCNCFFCSPLLLIALVIAAMAFHFISPPIDSTETGTGFLRFWGCRGIGRFRVGVFLSLYSQHFFFLKEK